MNLPLLRAVGMLPIIGVFVSLSVAVAAWALLRQIEVGEVWCG